MRPQVKAPDVERAVVDLLTELAPTKIPGVTIGVGVPDGWTPTQPTHLQVSFDGTPITEWPVYVRSTIRVVAWAKSPTAAKDAAAIAQGLLCGREGGHGLSNLAPLIGITPAQDPDTNAELAWFTVAVTARLIPIS